MKLTLIRHAKVNMTYDKSYDSAGFDEAQHNYDISPVFPVLPEAADAGIKAATLPEGASAKRLRFYVSTLPRTKETLRGLYGGVPYIETELLKEVPLVASFPTDKKRNRNFWRVLGRVRWFLNHPSQPEGRRDTAKRAQALVEMLLQKQEDAVLVTHEFYLYTLMAVLRRNGFRVTRPQKTGFRIHNLEHIRAVRP